MPILNVITNTLYGSAYLSLFAWILATGAWDNTGIWVDDAIWID